MSDPISPFDVIADPKDGFMKPDFFSSMRFEADVILDVGVSRGTPWLYQAFHDKEFVLIDPLPSFDERLYKPPAKYVCEKIGLGSKPGEMTLDIRGPRSTLHEWQPSKAHHSEGSVVVAIETLDQVIQRHADGRTVGVKIDTEGHEVEVLKGLNACVGLVEFIVCECSIRRRFNDDYQFSDLIVALADRGFELYNFLSAHKPRPLHYDCIFLPSEDRRFQSGGF